MAYDFSTLNDKDLESLAKDLLNKKFDLELQDFKVGKDKGIDLRYSSPANNNAVVVQVKHYLKSGFQTLLKKLVNEELSKIRALAPARYLVVTSLGLSAAEKDQIRAALSPFILSSNDVIGQDDLNSYLREFPEVEKNWFKLWLSSVPVLHTIIHNSIHGKSNFIAQDILRNISLYIPSDSYNDAFRIIEEFNYILITGQPGVGKTTLAKIMTYDLLGRGFKLVYIDDDISEAENVFNDDPNEKQLFYFDDFLGANYLEITSPKTTESRLVSFLQRIKFSKNKLLILTTRTTILKTAMSMYEKLSRTKIDIARKEIELGAYSNYDKARILYNHLYHSRLGYEYINEVFRDKRYWQIIKHPNNTPRLIEFITSPENINQIPVESYFDFLTRNLDNPSEVWLFAYEKQFTIEDRLLVQAVFSLTNPTTKQLQSVFFDLLRYQTQYNNYHVSDLNPFVTSLKKLLDGIIKKEVIKDQNVERISFINPSITDFLINYLIKNNEQKWQLVKSARNIEQLEIFFTTIFNWVKYRTEDSFEDHGNFAELILARGIDQWQTIRPGTVDIYYCELKICSLLTKLMVVEQIRAKIDMAIVACLNEVELILLGRQSTRVLCNLVEDLDTDSIVAEWVHKNWIEITHLIFEMAMDEDDLSQIMELFKKYGIDYSEYISNDENLAIVQKNLDFVADEGTEATIDDEKSSIRNSEDWERVLDTAYSWRRKLYNKFLLDDINYDDSRFYEEEDIRSIMERNNHAYDDEDWKEGREMQGINSFPYNETEQIDNLFQRDD